MPFKGSTILIEYRAPGGSYIDITNSCIFATWSFTLQMAAMPGTFEGTVRDPQQTHSFVTGGEIRLTIDSFVAWGGYVLQVERTFAFPADNTVSQPPSAVKSREWVLTGSDYNYKLDKLVFRDLSNLTGLAAQTTHPIYDGAIIRTYYPTYFDLPTDWDVSTYVQDNFQFTGAGDYQFGGSGDGQGFSMRTALADLVQYGSVAFMGPDKALRFMGIQDAAAPWGISDAPALSAIYDGAQPWIGFRDGSQTEDLTPVGNDAIVWGGSQWANGGAVVADREQNATSITDHGRWQYAEVKVGDPRYKSSGQVTARAKVIVSGNTTGTFGDGQQGISQPEEQYRLTWFANNVPVIMGIRQHLLPGFVVKLHLWTFSPDGGATPFILTVPLRSVTITFPSLDPAGNGYVIFSGLFGVLVTDPEYLWAFLRGNLQGFKNQVVGGVYSTAGNGTTGPVPYGTQWSGSPSPATDGVTTVFNIGYGYIAGTTQLLKNGLQQVLGVQYTESDPATGEVTWIAADPLLATDNLWVLAILTG